MAGCDDKFERFLSMSAIVFSANSSNPGHDYGDVFRWGTSKGPQSDLLINASDVIKKLLMDREIMVIDAENRKQLTP